MSVQENPEMDGYQQKLASHRWPYDVPVFDTQIRILLTSGFQLVIQWFHLRYPPSDDRKDAVLLFRRSKDYRYKSWYIPKDQTSRGSRKGRH